MCFLQGIPHRYNEKSPLKISKMEHIKGLISLQALQTGSLLMHFKGDPWIFIAQVEVLQAEVSLMDNIDIGEIQGLIAFPN